MRQQLEDMQCNCNRKSTNDNYQTVWRIFNKFLIHLDEMPETWENRVTLFCAHLVEKKIKSTTLKSYISAIKNRLQLLLGYRWCDDQILLGSLTKTCKLCNDVVTLRSPIHCKLLEILIFEVCRIFAEQPYLAIMYQTLFLLCYYGLLCVGKVSSSQHVLKAKDVHLAVNKQKLLLILYSSKTHGKESLLQKIKIVGNK